jgi:hypothetical protein
VISTERRLHVTVIVADEEWGDVRILTTDLKVPSAFSISSYGRIVLTGFGPNGISSSEEETLWMRDTIHASEAFSEVVSAVMRDTHDH